MLSVGFATFENVGYLIPLFTAVIFVNLRGIFSDGAPKKVRQK